MLRNPQARARLARATVGTARVAGRDWLDAVTSGGGWTAARWFPGHDVEVTLAEVGTAGEEGADVLRALRSHPDVPAHLHFASGLTTPDIAPAGSATGQPPYLVNLEQGVVYSVAAAGREVGEPSGHLPAVARCIVLRYRCHLVDRGSSDSAILTLPDLRDLLWETVDALSGPASRLGLEPVSRRGDGLPARVRAKTGSSSPRS